MKATHLVSAMLASMPVLAAANVAQANEQLCCNVGGEQQCIAFNLIARSVELAPANILDSSQILTLRPFRRSTFVIQDSTGQNCLDVPLFEDSAEVLPTACIARETDPRAAAQLYRLVPASGSPGMFLIQNAANRNYCIGTTPGISGGMNVVLVRCAPVTLYKVWDHKQVQRD
ncbi:hypothetical protein [Polyangium aurulentum]|uniref:hypothetical protein n=1 Tax=Polyangium aurulentum TaxID=2567896 RepID=UPI0010AE27E9|nr:hypothetical protein [Polyangium aurulentum]UQA62212.1 hypothetical protein E8A73_017780 [Polyangium aurulentum]